MDITVYSMNVLLTMTVTLSSPLPLPQPSSSTSNPVHFCENRNKQYNHKTLSKMKTTGNTCCSTETIEKWRMETTRSEQDVKHAVFLLQAYTFRNAVAMGSSRWKKASPFIPNVMVSDCPLKGRSTGESTLGVKTKPLNWSVVVAIARARLILK